MAARNRPLVPGIPAIGVSRAAYSALILGYVYNVLLPEFKNLRKEKKIRQNDGDKDEEQNQEIVRHVSQKNDNEKKKPKGPAVNK